MAHAQNTQPHTNTLTHTYIAVGCFVAFGRQITPCERVHHLATDGIG